MGRAYNPYLWDEGEGGEEDQDSEELTEADVHGPGLNRPEPNSAVRQNTRSRISLLLQACNWHYLLIMYVVNKLRTKIKNRDIAQKLKIVTG